MIMLESEAKKKICSEMSFRNAGEIVNCFGSGCVKWEGAEHIRKIYISPEKIMPDTDVLLIDVKTNTDNVICVSRTYNKGLGECGLISKPLEQD